MAEDREDLASKVDPELHPEIINQPARPRQTNNRRSNRRVFMIRMTRPGKSNRLTGGRDGHNNIDRVDGFSPNSCPTFCCKLARPATLEVVGAFFKRVCSGHTAAPATPLGRLRSLKLT